MSKKRFSAEQIVAKLRQIEVLLGEGKPLGLACKEAGVTDVTNYQWRREYGRLKGDQAKRLKAGDCCVFCSYGTVKCPPKQAETSCCSS